MYMHEEPRIRLATIPHLGRTLTLVWPLYEVFRAAFDSAVLRSAGEPLPYGRLAMQTLVYGAIWGGVSWVLFVICDFSFSRRSALRRRSALAAGVLVMWAAGYVCFGAANALLDMTIRSGRFSLGAFRAGGVGVLLVVTVVVVTARGLFWWEREVQGVRRGVEGGGT